MKLRSLIYKSILAISAAVLLPGVAAAQCPIEVIDVTHGQTTGNVKAKVNLPEGRTIKSVKTYTWQLPSGWASTNSRYTTIDNYVIADINYTAGSDYFYSIEITLDDDSVLKTDMFNDTLTEGAVWASDLEPGNGGFNTYTTPQPQSGVDLTPDGNPLQIHPDGIFYKGLSLRSVAANGRGTLNVQRRNQYNAPFTCAKFTFGLQAFKPDGSASTGNGRVIFLVNNAETGWKGNMKAYSTPGRGNGAYYFNCTQTNADAEGMRTIGLQSNNIGEDNIAVLGALRLYYSLPAQNKTPQTITFDNVGGTLFEDNPVVNLSAYSSGDTHIYYSIVEGSDIATLEGNVLTALPGKSGEIVVEAMTFGDDTYAPASATIKYVVRFGPTVEYISSHTHGEDPTAKTVYLFIRPGEKTLEKVNIQLYDNVRSYKLLKDVDVLSNLSTYATHVPNVYAIPLENAGLGTPVHRLTYKFSGEDEVVEKLCDGKEPFIYTTDLPTGSVNIRGGWGTNVIDGAYGGNCGGRLTNSRYDYSKGYGMHAEGWMETTAAVDLSQFSRFCVDMGGQVITNPSRGRLSFALYNGVNTPYLTTGNVEWQNVYEWDFPLQSTAAGKTVKVTFGAGGDGNTNDVVCIGAPRFYYHYTPLLPQTIEWDEEMVLNNYRPFSIELDARTSTGMPVIYRVIRGQEYAEVRNGTTLYFKAIPEVEDVVEVEAFQPGSNNYERSETVNRTFRLRRSVVVRADERVALEGGHDIDELVIYANANSAGQATVESGIVNVKKLVIKYTFVPGEWNHISFPSALDLDAISDLGAKGFTYSTSDNKSGTYVIRKYDSQRRSDSPDDDAWTSLPNSKVEAMKGYIMKLVRDDKTPVEITFTITNISLDFDSPLRHLNVTIDMSECEPETRHIVYIRPTNVKGNTLRVDMRFVPSDLSQLPLNHARALEEMRITHTPVRGAIRLTLPEQTPAKVAIYDRKGKKLLKAVNYISPMKIDISDLKPGKYKMVVIYGPASIERDVEL